MEQNEQNPPRNGVYSRPSAYFDGDGTLVVRASAVEMGEAEADEPEQAVLTWAELFAQVPVKRNGRRKPPQPASLSLFEWAVQVEEEQVREAQTVS